MKQRPIAISLLVCEQVIIEEGTRNFTPVNCVSRYTVKEIPSIPFPFVAGYYDVVLLADNEPIAARRIAIVH